MLGASISVVLSVALLFLDSPEKKTATTDPNIITTRKIEIALCLFIHYPLGFI